jgi:hypothetical protein
VSGENEEEAAWLDLIAHYDAPAGAGTGTSSRPWPERENLAENNSATMPGTSQVTRAPEAPQANGGTRRAPADQPFGADLTSPTEPDLTAPHQPDWPGEPGRGRANPGSRPPATPATPGMQEEHYFPPPPPPLPKLDPVTKGAWLALFGGPLYLLISDAAGATISGLAAFLAVAAFVGGFVILVLRMDNGRPPDSGSDDDGAVV